MDYSDVIQLKLKTPEDLRHHLQANGRARHMIHDQASDWWWFCNHRNRLLEFVFNSGSPVTFRKIDHGPTSAPSWEPVCNLIPNMNYYDLRPTFMYATITEETLVDLFWNDFLSQDLGQYAYWDSDSPNNHLDEFIFYWEMQTSGMHLDPPANEG